MKLLICFISLCFHSLNFLSSTVLNDHVPVEIFNYVSFPVDQVSDLFTKNILQAIDATYGAQGMGLDSSQILHLKKTYLYLIFLTKLEKIKSNTMYVQYLSDFQKYLNDNQSAQAHIPDLALINSAGWAAIKITTVDLLHSGAWQLYVKAMIADIYAYFVTVLEIIHNVEQQSFNYMPHFEIAFYDADYTQLRTINEMSRIKLVLEEEIKKRLLAQCDGWSTLSNATNSKETLEFSIVQFRNTEFYKKTHDMHAMVGATSLQPITNQQILATPRLQSPLKEYVWCYFMLYEASGQITSHLNQQNLKQCLKYGSESTLVPNIFMYRSNDYVILDELLSVKSKAEGNHVYSVHPSPVEYHIENIRKPEVLNQTYRNTNDEIAATLQSLKNNPVTQQSFFSFFRHLGDDIKHGFEDIAHAVVKGFDAVKHFTVAMAIGIAGIGAELVGQTEFAHQEFEREAKEFNKSIKDLNTSIDDFTQSLKDGVEAPVANITGDLVGFITNDQKLGRDISSVIASVDNSILTVIDKYGAFLTDSAGQAFQSVTQVAEIGSEIATMIAISAWAIFSKNGREEFLKQGADLGKLCLESIAQAYTNLKDATMEIVQATMTALGVITNALTTIFIDITREITYLFTGGIFNMFGGAFSSIPGLKQAVAYSKQQADHVTSVLSAHRAVINTVMGVVACVAVDVATGGAATEMDAAIIGEAAADTASDVATESTQAVEEAESEVREAETSLKTLQEQVADGQSVSQETLDEASLKVSQAQEKLDEVKSATQVAKQSASVVAKKTITQSLQDYAQTVSKSIQKKITQELDSFKAIGKNIAKAANQFSNVVRSGKLVEQLSADIEEQTAALKEAQTELSNLPEDATTEVKAQAQQAVDDAQTALQSSQDQLKEAQELKELSTLQKVKRAGSAAWDFTKSAASGFFKLVPVELFMNVAFNMGNIIAGANQDAKNILDLNTQTAMMQGLWKFYNENQIATAQEQQDYLNEINAKIVAQIGNQSLAIALSSNLVNAQLLEIKNALCSYMAPLYVSWLITVPSQPIAQANIGMLWSLDTKYINLYPSQGFWTTTMGRSGFAYAQEIAQNPDETNLLAGTSKNLSKLWFNQKCTARDDLNTLNQPKKAKDPLTVQTKFKILYTLQSSFYTGLYLAGNYHNYNQPNYISSFLKNGMTMSQAAELLENPTSTSSFTQADVQSTIVDLDEAYLAKMVVLYRKGARGSLMLGVYEHEGLGWIVQDALPVDAQMDQCQLYTLQVTLDQDTLHVTLFIDQDDTAIYQKVIKVTPSQNQRTYGIISSGSAISWNQILPKININQKFRGINNQKSEMQREKDTKILLNAISSPNFGSYDLKPLSKQAMLLGHYIYATSQTDLKKILNDSAVDFVIFGSNVPGASIQFGLDPITAQKSGYPVIISLINGSIYNTQGQHVGSLSNVWVEYQKSVNIHNKKLDTFIVSQQKAVMEKMAHVTFGSFDLDIATNAALKNGLYVYTCSQTLTTATGLPIINTETNKPYIDYVVCAYFENNNLTLGLSPASSQANGLYSFVTGNLYAKSTIVTSGIAPKVWNVQNQPFAQFGTYVSENKMSPTELLYQDINNAITWYASYQPTPPAATLTAPIKAVPAVVARPENIFKTFHFPLKSFHFGISQIAPNQNSGQATTQSLSQRQNIAAGKAGFEI